MPVLIKLSLRPWKLAPLSHLFSALAVGCLLVMAGFLFWLQAGLKPVLARLQGEQVLTAYVDSALEFKDVKDEARLVDSVRLALGAHAESAASVGFGGAGAIEVKFVDSAQFVEHLKGPYPELARELADLGPELGAVAPRYVSVSGILPAQSLERVRSVPGIESAESSQDRYAHVVGAFAALRWVARLLALGIALALMTGLIHLARMNAFLHRDALGILRLWGAGPGLLRAPAMISGALVGALGGGLAAAAWTVVGTHLGGQIRALSPMLREMPTASLSLAAGLLVAGIAVGVFSGALGGAAALPGTGGTR